MIFFSLVPPKYSYTEYQMKAKPYQTRKPEHHEESDGPKTAIPEEDQQETHPDVEKSELPAQQPSLHSDVLSHIQPSTQSDVLSHNQPSTQSDVLSHILDSVRNIANNLQEDEGNADAIEEWKAIADIWERLMFWIVLVVVTITLPALIWGVED